MMQFICPRCGKLFMGVDRAGEVICTRCKLTFIPDTLDDTTDLPAAEDPADEADDGGHSESDTETSSHFELVPEPEGREAPEGPLDVDDTQHLRYSESSRRRTTVEPDPDAEAYTAEAYTAEPSARTSPSAAPAAQPRRGQVTLKTYHWVIIIGLAATLAVLEVVRVSLRNGGGNEERVERLVSEARDALRADRLADALSLLTSASALSDSEIVRSLLTDVRLRMCERELDRGDVDAAASWLDLARGEATGEHTARVEACSKRLEGLRRTTTKPGGR